MKGAVMYGQTPDVVHSRILSYTYGIDAAVKFAAGKGPADLKRTDGGADHGKHVFAPLARAGDRVSDGSKVTVPVRLDGGQQKSMRLQLYRSRNRGVQYTTEAGCEPLFFLHVDMPRSGERSVVNFTLDFSQTSLSITSNGQTINAQFNHM